MCYFLKLYGQSARNDIQQFFVTVLFTWMCGITSRLILQVSSSIRSLDCDIMALLFFFGEGVLLMLRTIFHSCRMLTLMYQRGARIPGSLFMFSLTACHDICLLCNVILLDTVDLASVYNASS